MIIIIVLAFVAILASVGYFILRRAGGGRFPWFQFYLKGRETGFAFREINLLRKIAVATRLENPTALFWSIKQLDRSIKGMIVTYSAKDQANDQEYNALLAKMFELWKRVEFDLPKYKLGIKSSRKIVKGQRLRITLPGLGAFSAMVVENLSRYLALSYPEGPKIPEGFSWKNQKIGISFWRVEDAGYFFQTKVLEDYFDRKYPIIHVLHSDSLVRNQKRQSIRVETDFAAELFPLKTSAAANEVPEKGRGLKCIVVDLSEGGAAILVGGKAKIGMPVKFQFTIGELPIVMCGVVKLTTFDPKKNRSVLHIQAVPPSPVLRNRILTYVYNLFGDRTGKPSEPAAAPLPPATGPTPSTSSEQDGETIELK